MPETFFDKWRNRVRSAWDVLTGRAWPGYGNPEHWQYIGPAEIGGWDDWDEEDARYNRGWR